MKTTLELPDNLLERMKIIAVQEKRRFKDLVAEILEVGLRNRSTSTVRTILPKPIKLRGGYQPTAEEIEKAIQEGRR